VASCQVSGLRVYQAVGHSSNPETGVFPSMPDESVVNDPYNLSLRVGILKVTEALPSSSCFTLGIPSGHSAGSHSTTRAISSTRRFPAAIGVEGAFNQAKGLFGFAEPSR
jgi:hypothetical protein